MSGLPFRSYSRYPAQASPKPAVLYSPSQSQTMAIASTRNGAVPQQVSSRSRNELVEEYRNGRASDAMSLDSKERYYQAHIAHLQAMLAREHMWFMRLLVISGVVFVSMATLILYFARHSTSCENAGFRFHIPIFSPFSSSHEKETSLRTGYSLQTAVLLALTLVIAWQNRAYISKYALQGIMSYLHSLKGSIA